MTRETLWPELWLWLWELLIRRDFRSKMLFGPEQNPKCLVGMRIAAQPAPELQFDLDDCRPISPLMDLALSYAAESSMTCRGLWLIGVSEKVP